MRQTEKTPVFCVVGPTASGKSALALAIAQAVDGEIINMDSMQIYRRMDIGTAKPTLEERKLVPHHLLDFLEPTESYSVAQYAAAAEKAIREIDSRGKLPVLVGGTGFYLRALTDGLNLGGVPSNPEVRARLKDEAARPGGRHTLHERLRQVDPATAERLHENDVQRVSRALEVYELTGVPFSQQKPDRPERPFTFGMIGTTMERELLYRRIERRVDDMLHRGLLGEVRTLLTEGVPPEAQAMQGIGYKELAPVVLQNAPLEEAVTLLKQNTRRYAKRQWTWFRAEERIQWLDQLEPQSRAQALRLAEDFRKENP